MCHGVYDSGSPQLEKPIPVRYWPSAIPLSPSEYYPLHREGTSQISSMAFKLNISVMVFAPFVVYPSIAWVSASIPVDAVRPSHTGHHIGIHKSHHRNIMGIHAYKLSLLLHIGDYIVVGNLLQRVRRCRNGEDGHGRLCCGKSL